MEGWAGRERGLGRTREGSGVDEGEGWGKRGGWLDEEWPGRTGEGWVRQEGQTRRPDEESRGGQEGWDEPQMRWAEADRERPGQR